MKLHIFNPEHDIALAYNRAHITMPHVAQELRTNLCYLPALWAEDGDFVLVDDIKFATKSFQTVRKYAADVAFIDHKDLAALPVNQIDPWGWDRRIRSELLENGVNESMLPTEEYLDFVRCLSDRRHTTSVLLTVRQGIEKLTCGESWSCFSVTEVAELQKKYHNVVVKAPWSSSGRGVRYIDETIDTGKMSWIEKTISRQGHIMVEPHYNKVCDLAAEFVCGEDGKVIYCGLSMFHTLNSQYTGNIIASEKEKIERLSRFIPESLYRKIISRLEEKLTHMVGLHYRGALGVDMMIVANPESGNFLINPCVEINLRRTMGHVALSLSACDFEFASMMSITHKVNYEFNISRIEGEFVNVLFG